MGFQDCSWGHDLFRRENRVRATCNLFKEQIWAPPHTLRDQRR